MKKRLSVLLLIVILVFSISGCQSKIKANEVIPNDVSIDKQNPPATIIKAVDTDPRTKEFPTLLKEYSFDFDQDSKEEKIELYTEAGRDSKGDMMWDDGQRWLLVGVDENKFYTIYSEFVQLGQVYFTVSTIGEEQTPNITVILPGHCGIEIIKYAFDKQEEGFKVNKVYQSPDENVFSISIPGY